MAAAAVRPAEHADLPEIARIQRDTWRVAYAELLPAEVLDDLDLAEVEQGWAEALQHGAVRLLVATEGSWTVGFAAAGPAPEAELAGADGSLPADADEVGMVATLLVEPRWGRRGHGGRLLAGASAALREQGARRGIAWVPEADNASLGFYTKAGWGTDGTVRTLDAGGKPVRELRMTGELTGQ